jgi:glycosyltransferase involved in cell wall biosynthesis
MKRLKVAGVARRSALIAGVTLWAQRRNVRVPRFVSRGMYALFGHPSTVRSEGGPVDGWTEPLVSHGRAATADAVRLVAQYESLLVNEPLPCDAPRAVHLSEGPALRCLIVTHALDVGGMDEMVAFLARGLRRHGVETTVLYSADFAPGQPGPGGRLARSLAADGVAIAKVPVEDGPRWIADNLPDVVSAHGAGSWIVETAEALGIPVVETLHSSIPGLLDQHRWLTEAQHSPSATMVVAVSDFLRREYLAGHPTFPPDRIVTVPSGVSFSRLARVDRQQARQLLGLRHEFLFVCLARYVPQKNLIGLVRAFVDVADVWPDAHLLIAGEAQDPLYYAQVRRLSDRSPHGARIHLRGNHNHPPVLLAAADAFVLDSFSEGGPLVSMEALCAGVPVVISDVGAAREQLGPDGERGRPSGPRGPVPAAPEPRRVGRRHGRCCAGPGPMGWPQAATP